MPKKIKLRDVVFLPPDIRRKMKFNKAKRVKRPRVERRIYNRDELIEYLKQNNFDSINKLRNGRTEVEPELRDYIKEFGRWSKAKKIAFGSPMKIDEFIHQDAAYMVKVVIEFGLWKSKDWKEKSKSNRDVIPSFYRVKKEWGSFSNMVGYAYQVHMKGILNDYISLWMELGKKPTLAHCDEEGINLEIPIEHFGSKNEMDSFLKGIEI
jgi:hypothetical protein